MKLSAYLHHHGITQAAFAEKAGASPFAVGKWVRGQRTPRPAALARISHVTGGLVTANDFVEFPSRPFDVPPCRDVAA